MNNIFRMKVAETQSYFNKIGLLVENSLTLTPFPELFAWRRP